MFDMFMKDPELCGNTVYIRTLDGKTVGTYDALSLTYSWLTMSKDSFYDQYGFNWIPPLDLQDKARKAFDL